MARLLVSRKTYDDRLRIDWTLRHRQVLDFNAVAPNIRDILLRKMRRRGRRTRRFFGEAYVASVTPHRDGYYSSFKWLTNALFLTDKRFRRGSMEPFERNLRQALREYFGIAQMARLQRVTREFFRAHRKMLNGKRPVAPDLWLIDNMGNHRFIEVKLPGDSVAPHQVAGMALIASCLQLEQAVSVELVELHPDERGLFTAFCNLIKGLPDSGVNGRSTSRKRSRAEWSSAGPRDAPANETFEAGRRARPRKATSG